MIIRYIYKINRYENYYEKLIKDHINLEALEITSLNNLNEEIVIIK
jgi:hypothetical protein